MSDTNIPTLTDATRNAADRATGKVKVARSATIVSYTAATNTARVRPSVRDRVRIDGETVFADELEIPNLPVIWPGVPDVCSFMWPLPAGTDVTLLVRDVSHDEVDAGLAIPSTPASTRRWDLSDAEVIPFGFNARNTPPDGAYSATSPVTWLADGKWLAVGADDAAKTLALAQETAARIARVESFLNGATYAVSGTATVAPSPAPFTGATGAPACVASVVVGSVAGTTEASIRSTRIKVDE